MKPRASPSNGTVDTQSQEAFPSLAPAAQAGNKPVASAWSAAAGPRIKPVASKQPVVSDTFELSSIDLSTAGKDGKPASLGEIIRQVQAQYKVKLDASTNQKSRQTTFFLKADSKKELDKAKRTSAVFFFHLAFIPVTESNSVSSVPTDDLCIPDFDSAG